MPKLHPYQRDAARSLNSGSILCGRTGLGKSITALSYFFATECGGSIDDDGAVHIGTQLKRLVIITTARKRDTFEWDEECSAFGLKAGEYLKIDSWNNIHKYTNEKGCFFIFDEQRVGGGKKWSKMFIAISKRNRWILLSATPGDTWKDYIPVFIANGFYKSKAEFLRNHAVYNRYSKYPKIDSYIGKNLLERYRRQITVLMDAPRKTKRHAFDILTDYNRELVQQVVKYRWDPIKNEPLQDISSACYTMRRIVNSDPSRLYNVRLILAQHPKAIVFYNYDYELDILRTLSDDYIVAEWNGHKHEPLPVQDIWVYLVQYTAGAEGWNCTQTDTIIFYSQNYSYKTMEQAAGRIDRLNTRYIDLYYYTLKSGAPIDKSIARALSSKKDFNEKIFMRPQLTRNNFPL